MVVVCSHILKYDSVTCLPPYDDADQQQLASNMMWSGPVLCACVCVRFFHVIHFPVRNE